MYTSYSIGNYHKINSPVHKLNPIFKILSILSIVISTICMDNYYKMLFIGIFIILVILLSKIRIRLFIRNIYRLKVLILFIILINLLFKVDINITIISIFKIIYITTYTSILTYTTTSSEISYAITKILSPLKSILPVSKISLSITLALRFIPTVMNEGNRIIKAATVRGRDLYNENIIGKIEIIAGLITPMIVLSLKRADILSDIMLLRLYDYKKNRTYYLKKNITFMDILLVMISIQLLVIVIMK